MIGDSVAAAMSVATAMISFTPQSNYASSLQNVGNDYDNVWEVIRELVINSYDALCKKMFFYPRTTCDTSLLICVDDGHGMSNDVLPDDDLNACRGNPRSRLNSYFDIGNSTRQEGVDGGKFGIGSKLEMLMADRMFEEG